MSASDRNFRALYYHHLSTQRRYHERGLRSSQRQKEIRSSFEDKLSQRRIDIAAVQTLIEKVGVPADLRALLWKICSGAVPQFPELWTSIESIHRDTYRHLQQASSYVLQAAAPSRPKRRLRSSSGGNGRVSIEQQRSEVATVFQCWFRVSKQPVDALSLEEQALLARVFSSVVHSKTAEPVDAFTCVWCHYRAQCQVYGSWAAMTQCCLSLLHSRLAKRPHQWLHRHLQQHQVSLDNLVMPYFRTHFGACHSDAMLEVWDRIVCVSVEFAAVFAQAALLGVGPALIRASTAHEMHQALSSSLRDSSAVAAAFASAREMSKPAPTSASIASNSTSFFKNTTKVYE